MFLIISTEKSRNQGMKLKKKKKDQGSLNRRTPIRYLKDNTNIYYMALLPWHK